MAPSDADLDNSIAVTVVTGVLYVGWLSILSSGALWFGIEPLPTIEARFDGWFGTVAAVAVGVIFIAVSRNVFDVVRRRFFSSPEPEDPAPTPDVPTESGTPAAPKRKRRKKKKKKKR